MPCGSQESFIDAWTSSADQGDDNVGACVRRLACVCLVVADAEADGAGDDNDNWKSTEEGEEEMSEKMGVGMDVATTFLASSDK